MIGNTGYGYGDSDLVAYSERLMLNFTQALGDRSAGAQTVGRALLQAKQGYYNSASAGSLSNYDEKVLAETTLYGLPMLQINLPTPLTQVPQPQRVQAQDVFTTRVALPLAFTPHAGSLGTFYTIVGEEDAHAAGARPIEPRTNRDVHVVDTIAHGALMLGGTFTQQPIDPFISRVVTDELYLPDEPHFPTSAWYPMQMSVVNRFLAIDGQSHERLVVVPGQFKATTDTPATSGLQRLYTWLDYEVYHAPFTVTDFIAPSIWNVEAYSTTSALLFRALVTDDQYDLRRVVILYRPLSVNTWSRADLAYDPLTHYAFASVPPLAEDFEYFVQAVDPAGNVALALDHGNPFRQYSTVEARLDTATTTLAENAGSAIVAVTLSTPPVITATIDYATLDGTAHAGSDYVAANGMLIFSPGMTRTTINLTLLNDNVYETSEDFTLNLSNPVNASLSDLRALTFTLLDDDALPAVAFAASTYLVSEASGRALLTVTLNHPSALTTTVAYATTDGTASAGSDYVATSGTLTFAPLATSLTFRG